jgi:hypothetical protein
MTEYFETACFSRGAPGPTYLQSMESIALREWAAMAFLYRLLPPRPTFAEDMSSAEAGVMERHVAYWQDLLNRSVALAFGPVLDPNDPWGLGLVDLDDEQAAREIGGATRRCRAAPAPTSSYRWSSCGPAESRGTSIPASWRTAAKSWTVWLRD